MPDNDSRRDDAEMETLRRKLRPDPRRTAIVLALLVVCSIGGILFAITHAFKVGDAARERAEQLPTPEPEALPSPFLPFETDSIRKSSRFVAGRQAVAVRTGKRNAAGKVAQGSGFLLSNGLVISAAHIFVSIQGSEAETVYVLCDDVERAGTVMAIDPLRDVVAISSPECHANTLSFGATEARTDEGLHVAGYNFAPNSGLSFWYERDTSVIPNVEPDPLRPDTQQELSQRLLGMKAAHVTPYVAIAGALVPGNSGSAVYDDHGRIVGMLVAADARFNRSYCVPADTIKEVLSHNGLRIP